MINNTVSKTVPHVAINEHRYPLEQAFLPPLLLGALCALLPAILIPFIVDPLDMNRVAKILFGNWISPLVLWFFVSSLLHLWMKSGRLTREQKQTRRLSEQVLPSVLAAVTGTVQGNDLWMVFRQQVMPQQVANNNLLMTRLQLFLSQSHANHDMDEAFGITEREYMRGSFSLSRFMVWAIPILGFIGTVWGISNGIAHFSDAMTSTSSVTDVSSMLKDNLPLVTNSLATAFDTTLLALLLSVPLMMVMIWLEKREEAYLIQLDQQWFHDIKPKLVQVSGMSVGTVKTTVEGTNMAPVQSVANEIKLLSTQVAALQATMEDLYEITFESCLGDYKKHDK